MLLLFLLDSFKQTKGQGIIFIPLSAARLPRSDAGCKRVQPASGLVIQDRQIKHFSGCPMCGTLSDNVVCGLFVGTTLTIRERSETPFVHGRAKASNTGTQTIESYPGSSGQTHAHRSGTDLGNESMEG